LPSTGTIVKNAVLPTLVGAERIVSANALIGLSSSLGRIIGGPLGGVLLAFAGLGGVALIDIATYLGAAALVATLPRQRTARATEPPPRSRSSTLPSAPIKAPSSPTDNDQPR
jgi:predicted MFS family arabinose efflux permease